MSEVTDTVQILNGNIIQIKRGFNKPDNGTLAPYELGYATESGFLYIGGALKLEQGAMKYGDTQGINVDFATNATDAINAINAINAKKLVDDDSNVLNIGSLTKPVYFENGIPVVCKEMLPSAGGSISGNLTINGTLTVVNKTTVKTLSVQGPLLGSTYSCGTSFPPDPVEGQLFFKIVG